MITIMVHLHTVLQRQTPEGPVRRVEAVLPAETTVAALMRQLEVDYPEPLLVVVNGRRVEPGHILQNGDQVHLVPPISGG